VVRPNFGDKKLMAKVKRRLLFDDRNGPDIQFPGGSTEGIKANLITKSMVSDCNLKGRH